MASSSRIREQDLIQHLHWRSICKRQFWITIHLYDSRSHQLTVPLSESGMQTMWQLHHYRKRLRLNTALWTGLKHTWLHILKVLKVIIVQQSFHLPFRLIHPTLYTLLVKLACHSCSSYDCKHTLWTKTIKTTICYPYLLAESSMFPLFILAFKCSLCFVTLTTCMHCVVAFLYFLMIAIMTHYIDPWMIKSGL